MVRDIYGNQHTIGQFLNKWKKGIEGITSLQQQKIIVRSNWISLIGIVGGIIVTAFFSERLWWLLLILIGAFGITVVQQVGNLQKYWAYKRAQEQMNEIATSVFDESQKEAHHE